MKRSIVATLAALAVFVTVGVGALALVGPFEAAGYRTVEDPTNPANSVFYLVAILVATGVMLLAFRYGVDLLIKALVVGSSVFLTYYVLSVLLPPVLTRGGVNLLAAGVSVGLGALLVVHPEWYVIDGLGVLMGMGAAALFGISFGLLPALVLLTALAVYDAISVYGTEHMLTLASGVMDLKTPVVLVIPLTLDYSFIEDGIPAASEPDDDPASEATADTDVDLDVEAGGALADDEPDARQGPAPEERDAFFIGLGDAVMPTILVASAASFVPTFAPGVTTAFGVALPALTAFVGMLAGLVVLVRMVMKGRAHAGLPLLNGGAIGGYLLGALLAGVPLLDAVGLASYL